MTPSRLPQALVVLARWLALAALAAGAGSCQSASEPTDDPLDTVRRALGAFADRDVDGLCELLSRQAVEVLGRAAHLDPRPCPVALRQYLRWIRPYDRSTRMRVMGSTSTRGRRTARVLVTDRGGSSTLSLPLRREGGRWKLDGLFDASLSRIQVRGEDEESTLAVSGRPSPAHPPPAVRVRRADPGGRTSACPAISASDLPLLSGGCELSARGHRIRLSVRTAFGRMPFGDCSISFDVLVGRRGVAWIDDLGVSGGGACLDAMMCWDRDSRKVPWPARLEPADDGGVRLIVSDACLDTCVGRFVGDLAFELDRHAGGWRMRAERAMIGATGWELDGTFGLHGDRPVVDLHRAGRRTESL